MPPEKEASKSAFNYLSKRDRRSLLNAYYKRKGDKDGLTKREIKEAVGPLESVFKDAKIRIHLLALAERQIRDFIHKEKKHKK